MFTLLPLGRTLQYTPSGSLISMLPLLVVVLQGTAEAGRQEVWNCLNMLATGIVIAFGAVCGLFPSPPLHPYPEIHDGQRVGSIAEGSPDPFQNFHWDLDGLGADRYGYQQYTDPAPNLTFTPASSFRAGHDPASFEVHGIGVATVRFAQEAACWIEFNSSDMVSAGGALDISISEGSLPGGVGVYRIKPTQYESLYRLETNNQLYEGIWYAFVNITSAGSRPWTVSNFRRVCQVVPTNYVGSFHSSDALLNRIWYVGAYTIKVTQVGAGIDSVGGYLGSELKDRGDRIAFLGDAHATQASALVAFGNFDMLTRSNNYTKDIQNDIQPYWVMWVLSVLDLYDATGDKDTLLSLQPWIEKRLNFGLVVAAPTGSLRWSRDDERMGFGFESPDRPEAFRAFLALLAGASRRYATVIGALGNTTAATVYHSLAQNVTSRIRNGTDWISKWGMHASADAINAGLVTPIEAAAMLGNMGVFGDPLQLPSLSIFESFFVLRAFGKVNATLQAMYLIKRHYGGMLALGATTTWERFDPQWTDAGCLAPESPPVNAMNSDTSMAHPWAAGATAWLTTYGLGVRATAPGFVRWVALPTIVDLDQLTSVRGTVPTPNGVIRFDLNITRGTLRVDVPAGTVAERIGLPMLGAGFRLVTTAGTTLFSNDSTALKSATNVEHDDRYLYVLGLTPGNYELAFEMHQPTMSVGPMLAGPWNPSNTSFLFPATYHGTDKVTSGVWRGKYGARGYKLFAMGPNGTDIERLPLFIHGVYAASIDPPQGGPPYPKPDTVSCKSAKGPVYACWQWGTTTNDPRVLENPEPSERRVLGGVTSKGWASFHLDVDVEESSPRFNITLFMLDADNLSIRQALKVRDGRTLHTISPMILVEDFSAVGAYVTIEYNGPMRIRFNEVPSPKGNKLGFPPRPVLSGVFFD